MSWAKFDDRYDDNRKVKRAWKKAPEAVALHVMATTYCARHETDGRVDLDWIEEKLPHSATRKRVLEVLVTSKLFDEHESGDYIVHDFLDFNESHAVKESRRKADRERKAKGGRHGLHAEGSKESDRNPTGIQAESGSPVPSRPVPVPTLPTSADADPEIVALCEHLAERMQSNDPKAKVAPTSERWLNDMRLLVERDGRTPADVRRIIDFAQADDFWRANILSPNKLRDKFPQLTLKAQGATGGKPLANSRDFSRFDQVVGQ